jgi:hypothetical protein
VSWTKRKGQKFEINDFSKWATTIGPGRQPFYNIENKLQEPSDSF